MSTCLRSGAFACLLIAALAHPSTAGMIGFTVSPTIPAPDASLGVKPDGSIVATNINVTLVFGSPNAATPMTQYSISAYLDFTTGTPLGKDADGNMTYSNANGDFFILGGPLEDPIHGAYSTPLAHSVDMLTTVIAPTTPNGQYQLVATLLSAGVDPAIAQSFGMTGGLTFNGTFTASFSFDSSKAGDQVSGGSINLAQFLPTVTTPAPPSLVLSALGMVGMAAGRFGSRFKGRRAPAVA